MSLLSRKDLLKYFAEMLVVVLGILIAFQVEEWREDRQKEQDLLAAFQRLAGEIDQNLPWCTRTEKNRPGQILAIQHVYLSLDAGRILNDDVAMFDQGLGSVGQLLTPPWLTTVAEEMIATGLLKEIDDPELAQSIAIGPDETLTIRQFWGLARERVEGLVDELADFVDITAKGRLPSSVSHDENLGDRLTNPLQESSRITYDFEQLAENRRIKNLFYEAADAHHDLLGFQRLRCSRARDLRARLTGILGETE